MKIDPRITESILEDELPSTEDFIKRVQFCAKALAYGAANDLWLPSFTQDHNGHWEIIDPSKMGEHHERFNIYFAQRGDKAELGIKSTWKSLYPRAEVLQSLGYLDKSQTTYTYMLTEKAYELLDKPLVPPNIFISYKRGVSTELGLLIEQRLKLSSWDISPFLDKQIRVGDEWEKILEQKIDECNYFVLLIGGPGTFKIINEEGEITDEGTFVIKEIKQAGEQGKTIIPIWHGKYPTADLTHCPEKLHQYINKRNYIEVGGESATEYEEALLRFDQRFHKY